MEKLEALEWVWDLAEQKSLTIQEAQAKGLQKQYSDQQQALRVVSQMIQELKDEKKSKRKHSKELSNQDRLNNIIFNSLYTPKGDPNETNLEVAAEAYTELKNLGLYVDDEEDALAILQGDNIYGENFLEDLPEDDQEEDE